MNTYEGHLLDGQTMAAAKGHPDPVQDAPAERLPEGTIIDQGDRKYQVAKDGSWRRMKQPCAT